MIQITPQLRILVAVEAIDGRKGIDSLAQLCREKLDSDPFSGCPFIFRNRSARAIRILAYDGQGFWLATKRLSKDSAINQQVLMLAFGRQWKSQIAAFQTDIATGVQ